ncbi:terpene cyclase/mutase family protein [Chengkuizengella marina]|uniref:terpene cyclase/mutase family protein n=1 Tax=Chengkuizengella marina TaxID=2507566 RepID=UPI00191C4935|nr:prenyltransferase/squalene oxidase repeat-containing protein [Chengkuizengella marina]
MITESKIIQEIKNRTESLKEKQSSNGAWHYCFQDGVMFDAFMIMTMRAIKHQDEKFIRSVTEYIVDKQDSNGAWKHYKDETPGNITASVSAYNALLFSGYFKKSDPNMKKAEKQILAMGGLRKAHFLVKALLAVNGQYPWPKPFPIPITFILLPTKFPLNFFDLSCYARVHFAPIMIAGNLHYSIKTEYTPDISHLMSPSTSADIQRSPTEHEDVISFRNYIEEEVKKQYNISCLLKNRAYKKTKKFMLQRLESDGTLYNYTSATCLMIYSFLALGYNQSHSLINNAINSMKTYTCDFDGKKHVENSPSQIWDTALISYSLQEAGVPYEDSSIKSSIHYLEGQQQRIKSDWAIHNPDGKPGGWGFTEGNTKNPDIDDTTAALRAMYETSKHDKKILQAWNRGLNWILSMQNDDGGWAAFEKNVDKKIFTILPVDHVEEGALDASSADLTGRTLELLGNYAKLKKDHPQVKSAINWLKRNQESDGSWNGKWGICYIYGTWAAITGLLAVGVEVEDSVIQRAKRWLYSIQNKDGGWGESCSSNILKKYVRLSFSTTSQTAWVVDTLIAIENQPTQEMKRGIKFIVENKRNLDYPTGAGFPDLSYIYYHSYNQIFPLLALSHYYKKYIKSEI